MEIDYIDSYILFSIVGSVNSERNVYPQIFVCPESIVFACIAFSLTCIVHTIASTTGLYLFILKGRLLSY